MREVLDGRLRISDPEIIVPLDEVLKLDLIKAGLTPFST